MPSPFPGMDPYLEDPAEWGPFHESLAVNIAYQLQPKLAPKYLVRPERREGMVLETRDFIPDVHISAASRPAAARPGAVSLVEATPARLTYEAEVPYHETSIRIYQREPRRLVTAIEILSPTNKRGDGQSQYHVKQQELLEAGIHLVEIDLLRSGKHTAAIDDPLLPELRPYDYLIAICRATGRTVKACYPFTFRQRMPNIPIPLLEPDPDEVLDLQSAFDETYDRGYYSVEIDYSAPPACPLRPEDAAWAREMHSGLPIA